MLSPGALLANRYRVRTLLASGEIKQIYLAEDTRLAYGECVIMEITHLPAVDSNRQALDALRGILGAIRGLQEPHLAKVYELLAEGDRVYIVREYVAGESLEQRMKRMSTRGFAQEFVITLALRILDGLVALHSLEPPVIYGNLKPSNVIIDVHGQLKLVDFGLVLDFTPASVASKIGARPYAAFEQFEHRNLPQSDLYALGVIMHQALSGLDPAKSRPFRFQPLERLRADLNSDLCKLVNRALAFNLSERTLSAESFRNALLAIKEGRLLPVFAPPPASPLTVQPPAGASMRPTPSRRRPCPHCSRRIPPDASICPYCARDTITGDIHHSSAPARHPAVTITLCIVAIAMVAFAGVWLLRANSFTYLAVTRVQPSIVTTPISGEEAGTEAQAYHRAVARKLDDDLAAFRRAKSGSTEREELRRQIAADIVNMNPPPGIPQDALRHLDRGQESLKARDAAEAAGEFNEALDEAPWLPQGYRGLARARELGGNTRGAVESLRDYLLVSPQADDAPSVRAQIVLLEQQEVANERNEQVERVVAERQREQQEEEERQARIRAQQQAEEEAREEQQRQEQQRQQAAQEQRCRENFVGRWGDYDTYCCGRFETGSTAFLGDTSSGRAVSGLGAVFQIQLDGSRIRVYQVLAGRCSADCQRITLYGSNYLVFDGALTDQSTNYSGNCSFTASGEIHHSKPFETVPVGSVDFYVSDDGSTLTWGGNTYRRQ
jgi:serine/threonine protein kinase/tetratricopeptide (TPR) repeat protein